MPTRMSRRPDEDADTRGDDRPTRGRRDRGRDDDADDRPSRSRGSRRGRDDDGDHDDRPARRGRGDSDDRPSRSSRDADDDRPARGRTRGRGASRSRDEDKPARGRGRGTGGFGSYAQKKRATSSYADEFKPDSDKPTLIKILDGEPFDVYNQHWLDEMGKGERKSYVCRDDEYFKDNDGCPLCEIGEPASTYSLFNILDLTNPRKPVVVVWRTSPQVTDKLERMSRSDRTSPLDDIDLYFDVTMVKKKNKTEWDIQVVKARDLAHEFDIDPFDEAELADYLEQGFTDRTAVTKVDSYDELAEIADDLDS